MFRGGENSQAWRGEVCVVAPESSIAATTSGVSTTTSTAATATTLSEKDKVEAEVEQLVTDCYLTPFDTSKGEERARNRERRWGSVAVPKRRLAVGLVIAFLTIGIVPVSATVDSTTQPSYVVKCSTGTGEVSGSEAWATAPSNFNPSSGGSFTIPTGSSYLEGRTFTDINVTSVRPVTVVEIQAIATNNDS